MEEIIDLLRFWIFMRHGPSSSNRLRSSPHFEWFFLLCEAKARQKFLPFCCRIAPRIRRSWGRWIERLYEWKWWSWRIASDWRIDVLFQVVELSSLSISFLFFYSFSLLLFLSFCFWWSSYLLIIIAFVFHEIFYAIQKKRRKLLISPSFYFFILFLTAIIFDLISAHLFNKSQKKSYIIKYNYCLIMIEFI